MEKEKKKTIERSNKLQNLRGEVGNWSLRKWWLWISMYTAHTACITLHISQHAAASALHGACTALVRFHHHTTFLSKKNQKPECLCLHLHMIMGLCLYLLCLLTSHLDALSASSTHAMQIALHSFLVLFLFFNLRFHLFTSFFVWKF